MLSLVLAYSIFKSGGRTFYLSLIPLAGMAIFELRKSNNSKPLSQPLATFAQGLLPGWQAGITALVVMAGFSFFQFHVNYVGGEVPWRAVMGADYIQHSLLSMALEIKGIENKFSPESIMSAKFHGLYPYHYFDLWLNAFFQQVTGLNNYLLLMLVTYPMLVFFGFIGILAIWETQREVTWPVIVLSVLLVGFGGLHYGFYNNIFYLSKANYRLNHFGEGGLTMLKLVQYLPFATGFVVLIIKKNYKLAFLLLTMLSMVYFSALVLLAPLMMFALVNMIKPIWTDRKDAFYIGASVVLPMAIFVGVFLLMGKGLGDTRDSFSLKLTDMYYAKTRINIMGLTTIQTVALYTPLIMGLVLMLLGKAWKELLSKTVVLMLLLAASIYAFGLMAWVVALENIDGMQLIGNNMPVANMLLLGVGIILFSKAMAYTGNPKWIVVAGALLFFGLSAHKTVSYAATALSSKYGDVVDLHSEEYVLQIQQEFQGEELLIGGFLKGEEEYNDPMYAIAHKISQSFKLGPYLTFMPQYFATVSMSEHSIEYTDPEKNIIDYKREVSAVHAYIFYMFVEDQKKEGTFVDVPQSQIDFINKYDIRYLIASRSAKFPKELEPLVQKTFTDSKSGERFYVLRTGNVNNQ